MASNRRMAARALYPTTKLANKVFNCRVRVASQLTFPDCFHVPAQFGQLGFDPSIPGPVGIHFGLPEFGARLGQAEQVAVMLVPEAAVDEDHSSVLRQNNIGASWQAGTAEPVTESQRMEAPTDLQLDLRILAADARHQCGTLFRVDDIGHQAALRDRLTGMAFSSKCGVMIRATSAITGTTTEFPNCL